MSNTEILYSSDAKRTKVSLSNGIITKQHDGSDLLSINKEIKYYKKFSGCIGFPKLICAFENGFKIKYYENGTLLSYKKVLSRKNVCRQVFNSLICFNSIDNKDCGSLSNCNYQKWLMKSYLSRFKDLLLSGPKGSSFSNWEKLRNKLILASTLPIVSIVVFLCFIYTIKKSPKLFGTRFHGDLHLNNVLVDENGNPILIDFENVIETPGMLVDMFYFFSIFNQGRFKVSGLDLIEELCLSEKSPLLQKMALMIPYKIYVQAVKNNPRFWS